MIIHVVRYVLSNMHLIMYENGDCYQNMNEKHRFSVMLKASICDTLLPTENGEFCTQLKHETSSDMSKVAEMI